MSKQLSLGAGFDKYAKTTRRAQFLSEMDRIVPWRELFELIAPVYPVAGNGRPPRELELMLRIYFLQQWFNLSDPAAEDALYDSLAMRRFAGLDLGQSPAPDETTICRFRHLLERNDLDLRLRSSQENSRIQGLMASSAMNAAASVVRRPSHGSKRDIIDAARSKGG